MVAISDNYYNFNSGKAGAVALYKLSCAGDKNKMPKNNNARQETGHRCLFNKQAKCSD
jgi:hypothetical protein